MAGFFHPKRIIAALLVIFSAASSASACEKNRWTVYYGSVPDIETLSSACLSVLAVSDRSSVSLLKSRGVKVIGYLSIGEAASKDRQWAGSAMISENPAWKGSYAVDVRNYRWRKHVYKEAARLYSLGYDGFMLDTADSAIALEEKDPVKYHGMKDALVNIIANLRERHPEAYIMLNRGFGIHSEVAKNINAILAESTITKYDFATGKSSFSTEQEHGPLMESLEQAKRKNPGIQLYSLDYWNMSDTEGVRNLYAEQRKNGFIPYVATPDLQRAYAEP